MVSYVATFLQNLVAATVNFTSELPKLWSTLHPVASLEKVLTLAQNKIQATICLAIQAVPYEFATNIG